MAMTKPTSEQVTFLQTGTGATVRTVDAKLKDWTSIKDFGNNIQTAVTAIGALPTTLIIDANCTISSNLVIPTTMSVWIENGAIITVNSGITFTCNAAFLAYSNKVFDGSGTVIFGINSISVLLTEWFGAIADGTTDCTSAFTKAVAASTDNGTLLTGVGIIPIQLLTGNYVVGNIILPPACRLVGSGKWTTGLLCKVGTTGYWLTDNGSASKIILQDFSMYGQSNASITYGIRLGRNAYPHGTEAYMDGIHVRDLPSGWGIDVLGNVSSYDKINVWSCSNGIYLAGVVVAQNLVVYACTNTSIKTNLVSILGLEIEAPATGGLPLDIEGNTSIDGLTISLANSTTISHVIEQRAAATAWSIQGLEYIFPAVPSGIVVTNGNFKLADGTYVGGNATAANHDGEGNYSSKSFSINGQKIQCFKTRITNTTGTIQHRVDDTANNLYRSTITNASTTLQNTPTGADATTAFAFGGKIGSASPSLFTFNTSNQSGISPLLMASIAFNNTGTSYTIVPFLESKNINGITITRPCLQLSNLSGVATSWSTALGTPGFIIDIQIMWFIA